MTLTQCDPCCNPSAFARGVDSFRQAELIILCQILEAIEGGGGGGGNPAPPDMAIQFNQAGAFGGDADFIYDYNDQWMSVPYFLAGDAVFASTVLLQALSSNTAVNTLLNFGVSLNVSNQSQVNLGSYTASLLGDIGGAVCTIQGLSASQNYFGAQPNSLAGQGSIFSLSVFPTGSWAGGTYDLANTRFQSNITVLGGTSSSNSTFNVVSVVIETPVASGSQGGTWTGTLNGLGFLNNGDSQFSDDSRLIFGGTNTWVNLVKGTSWLEYNTGSSNLELYGDSTLLLGFAANSIGFWGQTPAAQDTGWSTTNVTPTRSFDAPTVTLPVLADVVGTLIETLLDYGLLGA